LDSKLIVGSGLKEAIRDIGLMEDLVRDEACEKGIIKGGGIRKNDKADVAIFRGIKLNEVPAWADYGRGRGARGARGGQGLRGARGGGGRGRGGHDSRSGARGGQGSRGARARGRGRGGGDSRVGRGGKSRGRGRGGSQTLSGANVSVITEAPDRKQKLAEDEDTEEAKKVKLMELASPSSSSSSSAVAPAPASSSRASAQAQAKKDGGKNLLGILMSGKRVDVGIGLRLFD
jgi:hypothetical protein